MSQTKSQTTDPRLSEAYEQLTEQGYSPDGTRGRDRLSADLLRKKAGVSKAAAVAYLRERAAQESEPEPTAPQAPAGLAAEHLSAAVQAAYEAGHADGRSVADEALSEALEARQTAEDAEAEAVDARDAMAADLVKSQERASAADAERQEAETTRRAAEDRAVAAEALLAETRSQLEEARERATQAEARREELIERLVAGRES